MKRFALLCVLVGCLFATTGIGREVKKDVARQPGSPPTDDLKYDMNHLEKVFGIKLKSAKVQQPKRDGDAVITLTLEFTKDVPEVTGLGEGSNGLPALRKLFAGKETALHMQLRCYLFDEDGVVFTKLPPGKIEGEVTGKAGDAIRISQSVPGAVLAKTRKVSFREESAKK